MRAALAIALAAGVAAGGSLDPTWGRHGVARTAVLEQGADFATVAWRIYPDRGGIVVYGGAGSLDAGVRPLVLRFTPRGRLDPRFGRGGILRGRQLETVLPDGRMIVRDGTDLLRLRRDGTTDPTFGRGGRAPLVLGRCGYHAGAMTRVAGGAFVVLVTSCRARPVRNVFELMRVRADGSVDRSFGSGGKASVRIGVGSGLDEARDVLPLPGGKLLVFAKVSTGIDVDDVALVRFLANGRLDRTFGDGGIVLSQADAGTTFELADAFTTAGGRIVAAVCAVARTSTTLILRYRADGTPDETWGPDGRRSYDVGPASRGGASCADAAGAPGGKIVLLGFRVHRLTRLGDPDPTFGTDGSVASPPFDRVLVLRDGRIVLAGEYDVAFRKHALAVARLRP